MSRSVGRTLAELADFANAVLLVADGAFFVVLRTGPAVAGLVTGLGSKDPPFTDDVAFGGALF